MMVITYDGTKADRKHCAKIMSEYYKIGNVKKKNSGQCYPIVSPSGEIKKYRINSDLITWDYELKEYVLKSPEQVYGMTEDGMGYFTPNKFKNVEFRTIPFYISKGDAQSSTIKCIDEETAIKKGALLSTVDGHWYLNADQERLNDPRLFYGKIGYDNFSYVYNLSESNQFPEMMKLYSKSTLKPEAITEQLYKLFDDISFGAEIETNTGRIQEKDLWANFILPIRDGSIKNHEYVTVPFYDAKGLQAFINVMKLLQNTCTVDQTCSLHFHLGNILEREKDTKLYLITIYVLYYLLQNEIWDMIPPYKKSIEFLKTKDQFKDHCKNLNSLRLLDFDIYNKDGSVNQKQLDAAFKRFFTLWNDGQEPTAKYNYSTRTHVKSGGHKWDIQSRYYNLNLYNALFSKSNTLEFRGHGGTANLDKSLAWLLICVAISRFASIYSREILTETIKPNLKLILSCYKDNFGKNDICEEFGKFVSEYLIDYVNCRREDFVQLYLKGNIYGKEFIQDQKYSFAYKGQRLHEWKEK